MKFSLVVLRIKIWMNKMKVSFRNKGIFHTYLLLNNLIENLSRNYFSYNLYIWYRKYSWVWYLGQYSIKIDVVQRNLDNFCFEINTMFDNNRISPLEQSLQLHQHKMCTPLSHSMRRLLPGVVLVQNELLWSNLSENLSWKAP